MIRFFLSLWQFPQHLVGMIVLFFYLRKQKIADSFHKKYSNFYLIEGLKGGVSFGPVAMVGYKDYNLIQHEYGHCVQSMIFGPLYLLVIGLPSLIWGLIYKDTWKKDYYWFWTEKWANKLGKIK